MRSVRFFRRRPLATGLAVLVMALLLAGCARRLQRPATLVAPYAQPRLWAVAPLANESGVSYVDTTRLADVVAEQIQQVTGVDVVPVNRVLLAMHDAGIDAVRTAHDARSLMSLLDVDALVIGTVTAYDPYRPPRLGMALQLVARTRPQAFESFDPRDLTRQTIGELAPAGMQDGEPVAQAAGVFDAVNHDTLMALRQYASGRVEPDSAFGDDIYLVRMELFARFVSFQLIRDLLDEERSRLTLAASQDVGR